MNSKDNLVSVICPIFNSEMYLEECIVSVLKQTYTNFELILINDGSTDHSQEICEFFEKEDNRIVLINISNKGASEARNIGIRTAKGDYICFIDSDDFMEPTLLEKCVDAQKETNADLIKFGYTKIDEHGSKIYEKILPQHLYTHKTNDQKIRFICEELLHYKMPIQVWSCFLKKEVILKNELFLIDRKTVFSEDVCFSICLALSLDNTFTISDNLYNFRRRSGSIMWTNKANHMRNLNEYNNMSKYLFNRYGNTLGSFFPTLHYDIIKFRIGNIKIKELDNHIKSIEDKNYFVEMNKKYFLENRCLFVKQYGIYDGLLKKAMAKYLCNYNLLFYVFKRLLIGIFIKPAYLIKKVLSNNKNT